MYAFFNKELYECYNLQINWNATNVFKNAAYNLKCKLIL